MRNDKLTEFYKNLTEFTKLRPGSEPVTFTLLKFRSDTIHFPHRVLVF